MMKTFFLHIHAKLRIFFFHLGEGGRALHRKFEIELEKCSEVPSLSSNLPAAPLVGDPHMRIEKMHGYAVVVSVQKKLTWKSKYCFHVPVKTNLSSSFKNHSQQWGKRCVMLGIFRGRVTDIIFAANT